MHSNKEIRQGKTDYVVERNLGYSNEMMYNQCLLFYNIIFKTKKVKVGRGKNAKFIEERAYTPEESIDLSLIHI